MYLREMKGKERELLGTTIELHGWVKNHRPQKDFGFITFSDGTQFNSLQLVYDKENVHFKELSSLRVGSSILVSGTFQESSGAGQDYEVVIKDFTLLGDCPEDYPLQPKKHTPEFLRSIGYLRPRANLFQAVFRIRSVAAMAIHTYFQKIGRAHV